MAASRRDYQLIAKSLNETRAGVRNLAGPSKRNQLIADQVMVLTIMGIADTFSATYANFDRQKFINAALEEEVA